MRITYVAREWSPSLVLIERIGASGMPLVALASLVADRKAPVWDKDFTMERAGRVRRIRADAHVLKDRTGRALGCVMLLRDVHQLSMFDVAGKLGLSVPAAKSRLRRASSWVTRTRCACGCG